MGGPEDGFRAWQECSRGRPCDYTGLSYERLRGPSGIPWPCNDEHPDGLERLYSDGVFPSEPDYCENFGHDLLTGAELGEEKFRALETHGRAILKAAAYAPPHEPPDGDLPAAFTNGRTAYHFHTRTRDGTSAAAGPCRAAAWVEISRADAERLGISRRRHGRRPLAARQHRSRPARVGDVREGTVFAPFHYGYWDAGGSAPRRQAHRRERADGDRMGSGVEAADVQERGGAGGEAGRGRRGRTGPDHHRIPARRARRRFPQRSGDRMRRDRASCIAPAVDR